MKRRRRKQSPSLSKLEQIFVLIETSTFLVLSLIGEYKSNLIIPDIALNATCIGNFLKQPYYYETLYDYKPEDVICKHRITSTIDISDRRSMFYFDNPQHVQFNVPMYFSWMGEIDSNYICLKNAIVNRVGAIIINGTLYQVPGPNSNSFCFPGKIVEEYDSVIVLSTRFATMFGHWIKDTLSPFLLIPQDVRDRSYMLIGGKPYFALETLDILGFNTSRAIILPNDVDYVFAKECHTVYGKRAFLCHFGTALMNLSRIFRERLNLSNSPASVYAIFNRPINKRRHITNFKDLIERVTTQLFEYKWEIWPPQMNSVKEAAVKWNGAKIVMCPTGSNMANAIFMQKYSGLCTICAEWYDYSVVGLGQIMCVYQVMFSADKWQHFGNCSAPLDIDYAVDMLARTVYVVNNRRWPDI